MFYLRKENRLNRILVLALALLISNIAALSCAMAYALCIDTDCPKHPPVICEEPCVQSDALIADTAPEGSTEAFRPIVFLPALADVDTGRTYAATLIAKDDPSCEVPAVPLRLRFCVFLK
jgi:hypothetical protein